jgi:D-alanyl-D-alanine carboxypeptidase
MWLQGEFMNGKPEKSLEQSDDIPMALREQFDPVKNQFQSITLILGSLLAIAFIGLIGSFFWFRFNTARALNTSITPLEVSSPTPTPTPMPTPTPIDNVLGHLSYTEAPPSELVPVSPDGRVRLRKAAAEKFWQMQADAKAQGVIIVPLSGFRSREEQEYLFFRLKEQREEQVTQRAEVSAPPGYSEHHTGYALDLGDGNAPAAYVNPQFEKTAAFRWLEQNAVKYSFELSFPQDNPQGISYEPWHWRFVGDSKSLETFYKARSLPKKN